ncbi:2-hydroxyacid dehydrogenase [Pseudoduganella sp. GCM10020061]|uniref:2-hydroxyacid dehydrogenase n=1 Tax=Pseudoduganella sp. GCM10020061 TaxID=3317345 RepID=UPI00363BD979
MRILLHRADGNTAPWVADFAQALPEAEVVAWKEGEAVAPCDYAVLWSPPAALVPELQHVKAIFLTGAGVDAIMKFNDQLPDVPIIRLGDAGMAVQMAEYVLHAVLGYYRRMPEYEAQARRGEWKQLPQHRKEDFTVGVLGTGVLGMRVVEALRHFGFPVRGWSRSAKSIEGVASFAGMESLDGFLAGSRVLVNMLPLTPETNELLNHARLSRLPKGAYLVNVARGAHIVENDLLELVKSGHIAGATLDVFANEPLPAAHPFWSEPRITITPHVSALTLRTESVQQIAGKMRALARNEPVADVVDRQRGY